MSDTKDGMVSAQWASELVSVAGAKAAAEWVDGALCAKLLGDAKLGVTVGAAGGRVRVADTHESERLRALAKKQAPACAAWLDGHDVGEFVFETDGKSLRIYAWGTPTEEGVAALIWEDGELYEVVPLESVPAGSFSGAAEFLAKVETSYLLGLRSKGAIERLFWTWDGASRDVDAAVKALGASGLDAVAAHYASAGQNIAPYSVEWGPDGVTVCAWGANLGKDVSDLPPAFADGAPDAATFARELASTLPEADVAAGEAFIRDALYPTLVAVRADDVEFGDHLADVWRFLIGLLALEVPMDRLDVLRNVHAVNRLAVLQDEALELAKLSYAASHPDAPGPKPIRDAFASLDMAGVREATRERLAEYATLSALAQADTDLDLHRYKSVPFELATIKDLLDRALSGEFAAAEGPMHEYLVELGVTGYDDDPSLITLDNVDLDADAQDAAIEEALAMDLDDDDL